MVAAFHLAAALLMSRRMDDTKDGGTFIAERLSRLAEMQSRLLAFAEQSARKLEQELAKSRPSELN